MSVGQLFAEIAQVNSSSPFVKGKLQSGMVSFCCGMCCESQVSLLQRESCCWKQSIHPIIKPGAHTLHHTQLFLFFFAFWLIVLLVGYNMQSWHLLLLWKKTPNILGWRFNMCTMTLKQIHHLHVRFVSGGGEVVVQVWVVTGSPMALTPIWLQWPKWIGY